MEIISLLSKLVSFDTTSYKTNTHLIDFIKKIFDDFQISYVTFLDDNGIHSNILATMPDILGEIKGGILFCGHTDVVPVENQIWDSDPFQARVEYDKIYGRGTCDMKGFIAVIINLIPYFKSSKIVKPIHILFTYGEEIGCIGAKHVVSYIKDKINPDSCIVGEPTNMYPVVEHKGILICKAIIKGKNMHSSLTTQGCNAIEYASMFIKKIRKIANGLKSEKKDYSFEVPHTTISVNTIGGGTAFNIIPNFCEFVFDIRNIPSQNNQYIITKIQDYINNDLLPLMKQEYEDASIDIIYLNDISSLLCCNDDSIFKKIVYKILGCSYGKKVSFTTEAGLFQNTGIETIVCGPGSIEQAHIANEYIYIDQLYKYESFVKELVYYLQK